MTTITWLSRRPIQKETIAEVEEGYARLAAVPMKMTELRYLTQGEHDTLALLAQRLREHDEYKRLWDLTAKVIRRRNSFYGAVPEYDEWYDRRVLDRPYIFDRRNMAPHATFVVAAFGERNENYRHMEMDGKTLLGWHYMRPESSDGFLYVLPEARGTGISMQMVRFMETVLRMHGFKYNVETAANPRVGRSLEKVGYTRDGNRMIKSLLIEGGYQS